MLNVCINPLSYGKQLVNLVYKLNESLKTRTYEIKTIQKESVESESLKSSTQNSSVNDFIVINIPEEDVEPKQIILDPDDQPMWESAKTVASTSNSAISQLDVDDNFVINSTHLNMIRENNFDGYLRANPHDFANFSQSATSKTWFNELNEEFITSWEQMRRAFINRLFPPSLFNRLLLEIRNFSQLVCESLIDAWLRLKNMLRKCHGHGLTKGAIIQIFYHGLDEPTQGILDVTAEGIFLYKSPNQAFQFLEDKVLFEPDWPIKSKNKNHRKSVFFTDGSDSDTDKSRFMEKLKAMDSQIISLKEELQDMRKKYNELREENASKNHLNDDTPMCERHEANYIQSECNKDRNSHDLFSRKSHHDPNDSEKSLTELNIDVKNNIKDFKRRIRSMRTDYDKLYDRDDHKTTSVLPKKESKTVNQEPQSKLILKNQSQNSWMDKELQIYEWSKSQNISLEQTDWTEPQPPPQAQTEQVNVVFTGSGRSNDSPKTQKDPPPPIIVDNKTEKDKPIKTSKMAITW
ncbi:reverse transcriptase domain-containing protein [Tanacetum coccineum]